MLDDAQLFSPRDTARPTTGWPAGLATPRQPAVCMAQQGLAPTLVTGTVTGGVNPSRYIINKNPPPDGSPKQLG